MKRFIDIAGSLFAIVLFIPLFIFCGLLVMFDDGFPILYRQIRIGQNAKPFVIYKFRTMKRDAEKDGPKLLHKGSMTDPRLTRSGRFLRAHHLDEIPQLFNVLGGTMSFVGYRPERKYYIDQIMRIAPEYKDLFVMKPGVTSYATIHNGYTDTIEKMVERLKYDHYYVTHHSIFFDLKIIFLTFYKIFSGKKF